MVQPALLADEVHMPPLRGGMLKHDDSGDEIEESSPPIRGGGGGAATTARKRNERNQEAMKDVKEGIQQWLADGERYMQSCRNNQPLREAMRAVLEQLESWIGPDTDRKHEVTELVHQVGDLIDGRDKLSTADARRQSFYDRSLKTEVKPKAKATKKVTRPEPEILKFDLMKFAPKSQITTPQSILDCLEKGIRPKGTIAACRDPVEMKELQMLAASLSISAKVTLVSKEVKSLAEEKMPKNHVSALVNVVGHVCLVHSTVCCLSGAKPELVGKKALKVDEPTQSDVPMEWMRVTIVLHFVPEKWQVSLRARPALSVKVLGYNKAIFAKSWQLPQTENNCISGLITAEQADVAQLLALSGRGGVLIQQLAENIVNRPPVKWLKREKDEKSDAYYEKCFAESQKRGVPLAWRRGGNAELGLVNVVDEQANLAWAGWGIPNWWSPAKVKEFLEGHQWQIVECSEPRNARAPWRILGQQGNGPCEFELQDRFLTLTRWRSKSQQKEQVENEKIRCQRWVEAGAMEIPPTIAVDTAVAPTLKDSPSSDEDMAEAKKRTEKSVSSDLKSLVKKRSKGLHDKKGDEVDAEVPVAGGDLGLGGRS